MALGPSLSGLRAETVDNLILDAGMLYVNANITLMTSAITSANFAFAEAIDVTNTFTDFAGRLVAPRKLGATRGGTRVSVNKEERNIEADGKRLNYVGLQRISMIDPKITTSLLEMGDYETLQMALGSSTLVDYENFVGITPDLYVDNTDYYDNVALFATISNRKAPNGSSIPIVIVLRHVRVNVINETSFEDNNEQVLPVELTAHCLTSAPDVVPITFYVPKSLATIYSGGYY